MKLTKIKIEELVTKIEEFLKKHDLLDSVCIYFNNKRRVWEWDWRNDGAYIVREEDNVDPHDYFEYAAYNHILSMSFDGGLYNVLNGYSNGNLEDKFLDLLGTYDLYYELGNAWNLTCYPDNDDMEIEYTIYEEPMATKVIYWHSTEKDAPSVLIDIKQHWDELSATTQHLGGSCTIGDGFEFKYRNVPYKMMPPNFQGSCIYEHWIDTIKEELKNVGATDIHYNYGYLD